MANARADVARAVFGPTREERAIADAEAAASAPRDRGSVEDATLVTELRPLGMFATWQAEHAVGDHDRNALRLCLDLREDSTGFEPGISIWLDPCPETARQRVGLTGTKWVAASRNAALARAYPIATRCAHTFRPIGAVISRAVL